MIDSRNYAVKFLLQAIVGADIEVAAQQSVEGIVKILFGGVSTSGVIVRQTCLILLLHPNYKGIDGVRSRLRS